MSWAVWITGPPGSGKSTLARLAAQRLAASGRPVTVLELDRLRAVLTPHASYTEREREVVYRALVFMAAELSAAGCPVLIDATGHRRQWRDLARVCIDRFAEVQLDCPLDVCVTREQTRPCGFAPPDIYAAAERPEATVPGVNIPYERALAPELVVDTAHVSPSAAAVRVAALALGLDAARPAWTSRFGRGAVVWLTGLPGSGKTTLASRLADRLSTDGIAARILEWTALRAAALTEPCPAAAELDIAHHALALTAARLAEAGVVAVVDAAAPRRAWRELGRGLVERFAEVQLVCPAEICDTRERAVRWRPSPCAHGTGITAPEWPLTYEYSVHPDLIIDTALHGEWMATEDVLVLVHRLLARAAGGKESSMRVRDLMSDKPITVGPGTPMLEAQQRMVSSRIRHLIVTEGDAVVGIVTDRDIRLNLPSPATSLSVWEVNYLLARLTVGDVMTRSVLVIDPDRPIAEAARIMMDHKISALPVTEGRTLVGIVTESDFVRALAGQVGAA